VRYRISREGPSVVYTITHCRRRRIVTVPAWMLESPRASAWIVGWLLAVAEWRLREAARG